MTTLTAEDFWGDVVGSSTNSAFLLSVEHHSGGQAKVANLQLHVLAEKEVSQLEIPVYHFVMMHVLDCLYQLSDIALDLDVCESSPALDHVVERQVGAQL